MRFEFWRWVPAWHWVLPALAAAVIMAAIGAYLVFREERGDRFCFGCWFANQWDRLTWRWRRNPGFGDEWQREPVTEDDAADLIADLRGDPDLPGPAASETPHRAGELDVWDEWWAGIDGLERECMLVHDLLVSEKRLWAELKAETRELCAA